MNVGCWTFLLLLLSSVLCLPSSGLAQVPQLINYQGRLLEGTNLVNGTVGLSLRLCDGPAGGTILYEDSNSVDVVDGLYSTLLGDQTNTGHFIAALTNAALWMEVAVNGAALSPRERVASVAHALTTRGLTVSTNFIVVLNPSRNRASGPASPAAATISGGIDNRISNAFAAVIGGGVGSQITGSDGAAIGGGFTNFIVTNSALSMIGGGQQNYIFPNAQASVIAGGFNNTIFPNATNGVIGGGTENTISYESRGTVIAGGVSNEVGRAAPFATISGGANNRIETNAAHAAIGGGRFNFASLGATNATISGGRQNQVGANAQHSTIGGGLVNIIWENAQYATIAGGWDNWVRGDGGMIPGGYACVATNFALAAGRQAKANHAGAFVWGDSTVADVASTNANSVTLRAAGGYRLFSNSGLTLGAQLPPNATAWAALSDRNAKENFAPIDTAGILDQVAQLPLTAWTYKADPEHRRYIGPVAQDFHAAFSLGNDTTINTLDTDGVALAAIQALARENAELTKRLEKLERELDAIRQERGR